MPLYRKLSSEDCNDRGSVPEDISVNLGKKTQCILLVLEGSVYHVVSLSLWVFGVMPHVYFVF